MCTVLKIPGQRVLKLLVVSFFITSLVNAQESTNSAGGTATGSGGGVSYSVGQMLISTHTGSSGSLSEGVQQVYKIELVTSIDDEGVESLVLSLFPNPSADHINLQLGDVPRSKMTFQLFDMKGQVLEQQPITSALTNISLASIPSGTYLLRVVNQNKTLQTFKFIKER